MRQVGRSRARLEIKWQLNHWSPLKCQQIDSPFLKTSYKLQIHQTWRGTGALLLTQADVSKRHCTSNQSSAYTCWFPLITVISKPISCSISELSNQCNETQSQSSSGISRYGSLRLHSAWFSSADPPDRDAFKVFILVHHGNFLYGDMHQLWIESSAACAKSYSSP